MPVRSICGVILLSKDPEALAGFYAEALQVEFEREEHGGLDVHFGVDIGEVHFGIHPPGNFGGRRPGGATAVAFAVSSLSEHLTKCEALGAEVVEAPHDEGFGNVATLADPEGNLFELVELDYEFDERR